MAVQRTILLSAGVLMLAGGHSGHAADAAAWNCQRRAETGAWVCSAPGTGVRQPPAAARPPDPVRHRPPADKAPAGEGPAPAGPKPPGTTAEVQRGAQPPDPAPSPGQTGPAITEPERAAVHADGIDAGLAWEYCGPRPRRLPPVARAPLPGADTPLLIEADAADLLRRENRLLLSGRVVARRGSQQLRAKRLNYDRDTNLAEAEGNVLFSQPGLRLAGERARFDLTRRQAWMEDARYRLVGDNARGTAEAVHVESRDLSHFRDLTFTTCPPDSGAWELEADRMDLDRVENRGVARHAKLRVAGVPVLYTPYLSFALDNRRKSGFITPSIGNSSTLGLDLKAPYYLNLAPNMDATLTPRIVSKRGAMLGGEFRWITPHERGEVVGEIIPNDREFERDAIRGGISLRQNGRFGRRWVTNLLFGLASDDTYLEDFGPDLGVTSTRNLERRGEVYYFGGNFNVLARVQNFQTVDPDIAPQNRPYSRLPQVLVNYYRPLWQGVQLGLEAENVYFHHSRKVYGDRLALRPTLSLPLHRSYGHLIPRATLHHAAYWLTDQAAGTPDNPTNTVPTFSLDGGLVFERDTHWLGEAATQTLEPRLFYLYTPYEDQDRLPVFDTAELDFNFDSLFRNNRFSGRDRIGDANQITLALTSRTLAERSGHELLRMSIGQVIYFSDRRVQLAGAADEDSSSELAGELAARLSENWSTRGSLMWDPHRSAEQVRKASIALHYRTAEQRIFNLAYRLNQNDNNDDTEFEDADASFRWPVSHRLELVGRWLYSLRHHQTMDAFGGVEYGHCCWRVRALVRNYVNNPQDDPQFAFMLQFELAGLGAFGNQVDEFLERGVYGYEVE